MVEFDWSWCLIETEWRARSPATAPRITYRSMWLASVDGNRVDCSSLKNRAFVSISDSLILRVNIVSMVAMRSSCGHQLKWTTSEWAVKVAVDDGLQAKRSALMKMASNWLWDSRAIWLPPRASRLNIQHFLNEIRPVFFDPCRGIKVKSFRNQNKNNDKTKRVA